jgi:hypothetical protein
MGSSLTGLDTSFSSGREFWSSWQIDCSKTRGRVPSNGSNVWQSAEPQRQNHGFGPTARLGIEEIVGDPQVLAMRIPATIAAKRISLGLSYGFEANCYRSSP